MKKNEEDKIIVKMKKEYLSSERENNRYKTLCLILSVLLAVSFITIMFLGYGIGSNLINDSSNSDDNKVLEIKDILKNQWVYGNDFNDLDKILDDKMYYGLTSFEEDPYTTYMSLDDMDYFSNNIDKVQLGIGISYYKEYKGYIYVLEVYKDSGADNGGVKKGDRIVAIDQHSTLDASDEDIKEYVLGDEGTTVEIAVERNGQIITLECERKMFDSTAAVKLYGDIVVLKLSSFGSNTAQSISDLLKDYKNYKNLVIDLRNNSGGYQDSLLKIAGLFIDNNTLVMKEIDKYGNETKYYADYNEHYYNFENIVIITNENTASAAEVFAICMKEQHKNTTLIGNTTYGKGVVQSSYRLSDDSYLKVTTSYWTSPSGISLHKEGISPDIELTPDEAFNRIVYDFDEEDSYQYDSVNGYIATIASVLKYLGYPVGRTDGLFDEDFENALNQFKFDHGLETNGILDKETYEKIIDCFYIDDKDEYLDYALNMFNN